MFKKLIWVFILCFAASCLNGCSCNKNDENDDVNDENNNSSNQESELDKLLKDEPDATEFRVYFNFMDGSEYEMKVVKQGNRVLQPVNHVRESHVFEGWYADPNFETPFDFSKGITKSVMVYAKWTELQLSDLSFVLDEYVPSEITEDITLPKKIEGYNVNLIWSTDAPYTLSNEGVVNRPREDRKVTVNLEVLENGYTTNYSKEVTVKAIEFSRIKAGRAVFGYYATYNFNGYTEEQLKCDVINVSFAYVNADYTLDMSDVISRVNGYVKARKEGVRVVLSVQGYGDNSKNFSNAAKTEEGRLKLAQSMLAAVETYNFDGIDLDWEYPGWFTPADKHSEAKNFTLLVKQIYDLLKEKNKDYLLTAAIPGGAEGHNRYDLKEVSEYLDFIHLMTYDLEASSKVYHHTALYSNLGKGTATNASVNDSVEIFMLKGVPAEKIVIGIAFYGKYTRASSSVNGGLGSNSVTGKYTTLTYTRIWNNYFNEDGTLQDGVEYYFDEVCCAPYLYDTNTGDFVTYENEESISLKCRYARDNGLGGVMIWELGEDGTGSLMKAVNKGM